MENHTCGSSCLWGLVMMTVGFFFLVMGFISQTSNPSVFLNWWALLYYLIGFFLMAHGKHCHGSSKSSGGALRKRR